MERERIHAVVSGRVQGVNFRAFTARVAREAGISGWVRNRDDGTVELEAEGEPAALSRFLGEVGRGPALARVDRVETSPRGTTGGDEGFEIRRDDATREAEWT